MSGFNETTLGNVIALQRGHDLPERDRRAGMVPVIGSAGPNGWHDTVKALSPGVTVGRSGASAGVVTYVREPYWPHNTTLYVTDFKGNDPRFIAYLLETLPLAELNSGAAQPSLNRNFLYSVPVRIPSSQTQRRIASILGAYDDLIEVNRRRIELLEEMARRLFEEWFVHFRFPGHEGHNFIETPDGLMPEGWEALKIGDAFRITGGGTPSKAKLEYWNGGSINWYTPTDLTGSRSAFMDASSLQITDEGLRHSSAQLFPAFSVMMTSRATLGVISINTTEASTNQGFITCIPNDRVPLCFMTQWLRTRVPLFIAHASGATFKEITKGVFRQLPITLPTKELVSKFERSARPSMDMILTLERTQRCLASSRDLLLPRLISGELSVSTAEKELDAVA